MFKSVRDTVFIGKNLIYLPSCQSTNAEAMKLVQQNKGSEGTIIITPEQTAGRGQRGNTWQTEPNQNLTFSLILRPSFLQAQEQFALNITVSLAIYHALKSILTSQLKVKWPNDIYFQNQKIGGILIESIIKQQRIENSIIGIGLNVNQLSSDLPKASSLGKITGKQFNLQHLLEELCVQLEQSYLKLKSGKASLLRQEYLGMLYWFQEKHWFADLRQEIPQMFEGQIIGIDKDGRLVIEKQGKIDYFSLKEVSFIE